MSIERIEDIRLFLIAIVAFILLGLQPAAGVAYAQQPATASNPNAEVVGDIDIVNYNISAEMLPDSNMLQATTAVTYRAMKASRSVTFELNGSLRVSAVRDSAGASVLFSQDTLDEYVVRVDMGRIMNVGQEYTLTFDYAGQLASAEGGPLPDRRLAYVGPEGSYLHYASRWFPFHEYGADRATADMAITIPTIWKLAAHSEVPITTAPGKTQGTTTHTIARAKAVLPGTIAAAPYIVVPLQSNALSVEVYAQPGSEGAALKIAEEAVKMLDYYSRTFGPYYFGSRYVIAQIDDESLDTLAGAGIELLSSGAMKRGLETFMPELAREVALQWWGQAVGLRSFDATWLSQGLAQYSSLLYEGIDISTASSQTLLAEMSERALVYESEASLAQAPSLLNDQTPAFRSIILYKGAYVFHMLRTIIGEDRFFGLMRQYYQQNQGKNVSIPEFERLANQVAGQDLRWFFGLWVESTGVPEFTWDYTVLKSKDGEWKVRGTLRQSVEAFRMPVEVLVSSPGGQDLVTLDFVGNTADFLAYPKGGSPTLIIDPNRKILRVSDSIRTAVVVRRGIQEMQEGNYIEAESRLRDAINLSPRSSWAWYNLGLLYLKQANSQKAIDAFTQALSGDLDPTWIEVWSYVYRGNAYDALGQRERAVAEYDKAIDNGNDYDGAQEAAQRYRGEPYRPAGL